MSRIVRGFAIVLLVSLPGCGTIVDSFNLIERNEINGPRVYGGLRFDVKGVVNPSDKGFLLFIMMAFDAPLSLLLDTAILPVSLVNELVLHTSYSMEDLAGRWDPVKPSVEFARPAGKTTIGSLELDSNGIARYNRFPFPDNNRSWPGTEIASGIGSWSIRRVEGHTSITLDIMIEGRRWCRVVDVSEGSPHPRLVFLARETDPPTQIEYGWAGPPGWRD